MDAEVRIAFVLPRYLAAVTEAGTLADIPRVIRPSLDEVWKYLKKESVTCIGHNVALYLPQAGEGSEKTFTLVFGVEIQEVAPFSATVKPVSTPSCYAAMTTYWGDYTGIPAVHTFMQSWCASNDAETTGASWEVYGDWSEDPAGLRTDIFYQLSPGWRPPAGEGA